MAKPVGYRPKRIFLCETYIKRFVNVIDATGKTLESFVVSLFAIKVASTCNVKKNLSFVWPINLHFRREFIRIIGKQQGNTIDESRAQKLFTYWMPQRSLRRKTSRRFLTHWIPSYELYAPWHAAFLANPSLKLY